MPSIGRVRCPIGEEEVSPTHYGDRESTLQSQSKGHRLGDSSKDVISEWHIPKNPMKGVSAPNDDSELILQTIFKTDEKEPPERHSQPHNREVHEVGTEDSGCSDEPVVSQPEVSFYFRD